MENPNVWLPIHIEVSKNLDNHAEIVSIFKKNGLKTSEEEVLAILKQYYSDMKCGTSVVTTPVSKVSEKL